MAGRGATLQVPQADRRAGPGPRSQTRIAGQSGDWKRDLTGWAFALPFVVIFAVFLAGPVIASMLLSFTNFGLRDLRNPLGVSVIGLDNYVALFSDARFWTSLLNTAYFVVVGVPLTIVIGLAAATASGPSSGSATTSRS